MMQGSFLEERELPTIQFPIFCGPTMMESVFILDTGFSGDIKIDHLVATKLGVITQGMRYFENANGERVAAGFSLGYAEMEGRKRIVNIIIADGPHLAGGGLFSLFGYKAVADFKNKKTHLEAVI
jgi:predicted aspartyl protease